MKLIILFALIILQVQPMQDETEITGNWEMPEGNTVIEIQRDGDTFKGTVIKSDKEKAIGKEVLQDLRKEENVWKGKFYVVRRDRLVNATLKEIEDGILEMEVKAGRRTKTLILNKTD